MYRPMRERDIEKYFRLQIKKRGGLALKFVSPEFSGVPDRLILMKDKVPFFVEFKRPGGQLRARQEYVIRQFEALGIKVLIIDSINKCNDELQTL